MEEHISASKALDVLHRHGVQVSDFLLYGWLDSGQIVGSFRMPTAFGKPGRWQVSKEGLASFIVKMKALKK